MSDYPPQLWWVGITTKADKMLGELPSAARMAVFNSVRELLEAENPLRVSGVAKVQAADGVWRVRVNSASGDFRVLFSIESVPVVVNETEYKGTVLIVAILKKNEQTYRN